MSTRSSSARSSSPWCCSCRAACSGFCRAGTGSRERSDAAPTHVASLRSRSSPMLTYNCIRDDLMATTVLEIERLTKRFGGVTAVDGVSLRLEAGRIYGLIGPNGSGKTTLFNCITGVERRDEGRVGFGGGRHDGLKARGVAPEGERRDLPPIPALPPPSAPG